ncbi:MAG: Fic family protein [Candidatus Firestonebacteria bacterium]
MRSFAEQNIKLPINIVWLISSISEFKGKQDLYAGRSPEILKSLLEMAIIESAESSNRIEGVSVDEGRLKPLLIEHSKPRDRSEEEVAGYREALDLIHKNRRKLSIAPKFILKLHSLSRGTVWDAGKWKEKDNEIIKRYANGRVEIVFRPVSAKETPKMIEQLCLAYRNSKFPPLYAIACLVLDFLCIHPFRDGNGRISRLLTLAALYQHGYEVGRYVSIEKIVEKSKETYYESLNKSSKRWQEGKHDTSYWTSYFLGTIIGAYKELEERTIALKPVRGAKREMIINTIKKQIADFNISDIQKELPAVSRIMIKKVLDEMKEKKEITLLSKGRLAKWKFTKKK